MKKQRLKKKLNYHAALSHHLLHSSLPDGFQFRVVLATTNIEQHAWTQPTSTPTKTPQFKTCLLLSDPNRNQYHITNNTKIDAQSTKIRRRKEEGLQEYHGGLGGRREGRLLDSWCRSDWPTKITSKASTFWLPSNDVSPGTQRRVRSKHSALGLGLI